MATFPFELVSPERLLFSGDVEAVKLPGAAGEFAIMAGHAPLLALLGPGIMEVTGGPQGAQRLFIDGGFCDMNGTTCTVLAESAVPADGNAREQVDGLISAGTDAVGKLEGNERDRMAQRIAALESVRATL